MCKWNDDHLLGFLHRVFRQGVGKQECSEVLEKGCKSHINKTVSCTNLVKHNISLKGWSTEPIKRNKTALTRNQYTAYK